MFQCLKIKNLQDPFLTFFLSFPIGWVGWWAETPIGFLIFFEAFPNIPCNLSGANAQRRMVQSAVSACCGGNYMFNLN